MTEEDDTVEDVSRDADAEEDGIDVAEDDVLYGQESLNGDDVIGVVPRNKVVSVTVAFAVTVVHLNLHCRRHWNRDLAVASIHLCYLIIYYVPRFCNERTDLFSVTLLLIAMIIKPWGDPVRLAGLYAFNKQTAMIKSTGSKSVSLLSEIIPF